MGLLIFFLIIIITGTILLILFATKQITKANDRQKKIDAMVNYNYNQMNNNQMQNINQQTYQQPMQNINQQIYQQPMQILQQLPYTRKNLLTNNELRFYNALIPIARKYNFCILSKIRMADIIEVTKGLTNQQWGFYFGKIKSKHIDFILANPINLEPILLIEVDDYTHDKDNRQQRDKFIDEAYTTAGLTILHIRDITMLEDIICRALNIPRIG